MIAERDFYSDAHGELTADRERIRFVVARKGCAVPPQWKARVEVFMKTLKPAPAENKAVVPLQESKTEAAVETPKRKAPARKRRI